MKIAHVTPGFDVADQILPSDLKTIAEAGYKTILCHRPDGEGADQPTFNEVENAATEYDLTLHYLPVTSGKITDQDVIDFGQSFDSAKGPVLAYCRSGMRAISLWALHRSHTLSITDILSYGKGAGYDLTGIASRIASGRTGTQVSVPSYQIVIVGAGAAGVSVASSLLARDSSLDIAIIDPAETHYYQPGWTMVGGGVFKPETTVRTMASIIPKGVKWIKAAVAAFEPQSDRLLLEGCRPVKYEKLIVCPGIKLNWHGIEGLVDTLGENGVTSNYRYDLAPYTWELVKNLQNGKAVFTQPPMPIKCAGAPQKAMYLSADYWFKQGRLNSINIDFYNTGAVLFGVAAYVPALMEYVEKYHANLHFNHQLIRVDGPAKKAWFKQTNTEGEVTTLETSFDMIHVVPPQEAPDFIRASQLTDEAGWLDVNPDTLQHKQFPNIYGLGDVINAPNAKTAAAARKQAPVVATNLLFDLNSGKKRAAYDGYGSCPLTVEAGKIVLAEFGYGGRLLPSFPHWFIDGTRPSRLAWLLKERLLPPIYWKAMLKGREWLAHPSEFLSEDKQDEKSVKA